jgi:hypothetical protein
VKKLEKRVAMGSSGEASSDSSQGTGNDEDSEGDVQ